MRLYVIGAEGQVARALREAAYLDKTVAFGYSRRPEVDLLQPASVENALARFGPDIVVNPAAYTAVDRAESEPDHAFAINRDGAGAVAIAAARHGAPIIHLSTDYVFDGSKQDAYVETDPPAPLGVYGSSKLAGEQFVALANPKHVILRTSWVYAPFGNNFVLTMLRLASERDRLRVVDDQVGCPTYAPDIASAIIAIARRLTGSAWSPELGGVTNLAGPNVLSWYAFAREIVRGSVARGGRQIPIDRIATSAFPTPAARPANSSLSSARLRSVFQIRLPTLEYSLANCLDRIISRE